jgi:hypothetical protein
MKYRISEGAKIRTAFQDLQETGVVTMTWLSMCNKELESSLVFNLHIGAQTLLLVLACVIVTCIERRAKSRHCVKGLWWHARIVAVVRTLIRKNS